MPTDYYPVLVRAMSALDPNTEETRRAIYDRARLTIMDAGLAWAETSRERAALEAAIERIETELRQTQPPVITLRRRRRDEPRRAGVAPARPAPSGPAPRLPYRLLALAGAAVLMIAVIASASWLWVHGSDGDARRADAPDTEPATTRTTDGLADPGLAYILRRQLVYYRSVHPVGSIVIAKSQHYLYLVRPNVAAVRYTVGIGRTCTNAVGLLAISGKWEAPAPPRVSASMSRPAAAASDSDAVAARTGELSLALGDTGLRIDGADPPVKNGEGGCFAIADEDMADLYARVSVGARVVIN
jgi:lipoprotein-anchoring transpeptidase ErfK/SrfK